MGCESWSLGTPPHPAFGLGTHVEEGGRQLLVRMQAGARPPWRRLTCLPPLMERPCTAAAHALEGRSGCRVDAEFYPVKRQGDRQEHDRRSVTQCPAIS